MPRMAKVQRGKMFDEYLEVFRLLLGEGAVSFEGEYAAVRGVELFPVPLYFPGKTPTTVARVAKWGDDLLVPLVMATDRMETLGALLKERGRGRDEIDVVAAVDRCVAATQEEAVESYLASRAGRYALMRQPAEKALAKNWLGTPDAILEKIDAAVAQGIKHFRLSSIGADGNASTVQQMEMFAEEIMPQMRGSPAPQTSVSST